MVDRLFPGYLDVPEYARRHGLSAETVYRRIRAGAIPAIRQHGKWLIPDGATHRPTRTTP